MLINLYHAYNIGNPYISGGRRRKRCDTASTEPSGIGTTKDYSNLLTVCYMCYIVSQLNDGRQNVHGVFPVFDDME